MAERRIYAEMNADGLGVGYSYDHTRKRLRLNAMVVGGPKGVIGRTVHVDVDVTTLRSMLTFAETSETAGERLSEWAMRESENADE